MEATMQKNYRDFEVSSYGTRFEVTNEFGDGCGDFATIECALEYIDDEWNDRIGGAEYDEYY
jgi:hypothetical protein